MNTEHLYQHLNRNIPLIQRVAKAMTKDFDTARFLYQETVHQAIKNKHLLREDTMESWLKSTLKKTYSSILQDNRSMGCCH